MEYRNVPTFKYWLSALRNKLQWNLNQNTYDDVIKWRHLPRNWPLVRGIHRSPVDSPHKGQWLVFSLICASTNGWANNRAASDLRGHRAHYDVSVMNNFWGHFFWLHCVKCVVCGVVCILTEREIYELIQVKRLPGDWYIGYHWTKWSIFPDDIFKHIFNQTFRILLNVYVWSNWQYVSSDQGNSLVPNMRQALTWNIIDQYVWRHMGHVSPNHFKLDIFRL